MSAPIFALLVNQTDAGSRVYPQVLPQEPTYPAVTYQQVSAVPLRAMGADGSVLRVRVQVNCWGKTYAEALSLAGAVEARMSRFSGEAGGVTVLDTLLDSSLERYELESNTRRVIQDYTIFIQK